MTMSRLEAVLKGLDTQAAAAQGKLDQAAEFAARSEHLEVEGRSADEIAEVRVDGTGQVTSITLDDDCQRLGPDRIAADVMEAMRQAQRRLSFRIEQLGNDIYGEGSPTVRGFTDSYRNRYGYEPEEDQ
ncbi:YbaB/EbfC family nucleoid-associated protein [Nocardioides sp. LHG3406-4]|uniref:YbaB/EbfC family nucleoid-associated protein n=1 Tax=Nocardioides sp. LHG3406-4 TaxID=2804575 RepID=UPI003CED1D0B